MVRLPSTKILKNVLIDSDLQYPRCQAVSEMSRLKKSGAKIAIGGAVLLFIVGVVLARLWCPSASERANAITMEDIEKQIKSYERSQKLAKAVKELAETRAGSAVREEKLEALINLLDADAQAYIRSLPRKDPIEAITQKIKEENDALDATLAKQKMKEKLCWWR